MAGTDKLKQLRADSAAVAAELEEQSREQAGAKQQLERKVVKQQLAQDPREKEVRRARAILRCMCVSTFCSSLSYSHVAHLPCSV